MQTKSFELLWALLIIVALAILYTVFVLSFGSFPAAQSFLGHSLGVVGALLVLMTETLYSLRKRSTSARWGRMSSWLQFHIFTGLVGPFLIFLHTSWKFNGLAGILTLLMVIIVISGAFGRYIYTAIPRTADGAELSDLEMETQIQQVEANMETWLSAHPEIAAILDEQVKSTPQVSESQMQMVLGRAFLDWGYQAKWRQVEKKLDPELAVQVKQLQKITHTRNVLQRQKASLAFSRRLLSTWHSLHVPIGLAMFTVALIHMGAAIYYATLLR